MKGILLQGGRHVDISLGTLNGIQAALYFRAQMLAMVPLRPLALVIKALLKVGSDSFNESHQLAFRQPCTSGPKCWPLRPQAVVVKALLKVGSFSWMISLQSPWACMVEAVGGLLQGGREARCPSGPRCLALRL